MDNFDYRKFVYSQSLTKDKDTKQTLNENTPGYDSRKFGESLPTLESVKAAHEAKSMDISKEAEKMKELENLINKAKESIEKIGTTTKDLEDQGIKMPDDVEQFLKDLNKQLKEAEEKEEINEGDLFSSEFDRPHLKDIIRDLNKGLILDMPTRRAYKFLVSLLDKEDKEELGLNENMYIDDEEFEMEMGRSKKDSLKKEMMIHVDQLLDGNIDMNDFMNVVEDIMGDLK